MQTFGRYTHIACHRTTTTNAIYCENGFLFLLYILLLLLFYDAVHRIQYLLPKGEIMPYCCPHWARNPIKYESIYIFKYKKGLNRGCDCCKRFMIAIQRKYLIIVHMMPFCVRRVCVMLDFVNFETIHAQSLCHTWCTV